MMPDRVSALGTIDRAGNLRKDAAFVEAARSSPGTLIVAVHAGRHLVGTGDPPRAVLPSIAEAPSLGAALDHRPWVLLGTIDGRPIIAVDLGDDAEAGFDPAEYVATFAELRAVASSLAPDETALLVHARGLINWRRRHLFCGVCGGACRPIEAGHVMECTRCGTHHFPRTDPAVIMLVRNGERVLMARSARFPGRMFSALAGFVEPGESLEEAVTREVLEECGVRATGVTYRSSQPWPFPASIMLGFTAETSDETIVIDNDEIVEARWFTRADIRDRDNRDFSIPPRFSIARMLIDDWCNET